MPREELVGREPQFFCRVYQDSNQRLPYRIELRVYRTQPMPEGTVSFPVHDELLHVAHAGGWRRMRRAVRRLLRQAAKRYADSCTHQTKTGTVSEFQLVDTMDGRIGLAEWTTGSAEPFSGPWYS